MPIFFQRLWGSLALLLTFSFLQAQTATVSGTVQQDIGDKPIEGASVRLVSELDPSLVFTATSNADGVFQLSNVTFGAYDLQIEWNELSLNKSGVLIEQSEQLLGNFRLNANNPNGNLSSEELIPTVTISESEAQNDRGGTQNVMGLLSASRDVFVSAAAFTFGPARFRTRGYDAENSMVLINGMPMNELETGRPAWGLWGGLNDVMRNRDNTIGLEATASTFGSVGGSVDIDMRPSSQRKQFRVSYANSNRAYAHRLMATYSSGFLKGGWAISASASWRFRFGDLINYMKGTDYNAASYFVAIEKKLGAKHSLVLTAFAAPQARGRTQPTFAEMYEMMGTNYYNPNWGYQTSEKTGKQTKRNARESVSHQPVILLNHDWAISDKSKLQTAVGFQFGINGATALDWYDAADPRPDYYRKLPSYYELNGDTAQAALIREQYQNDPSVSQINWDHLYTVNRNSLTQVANANGVVGDTFTGNRAHYIVSNRRTDSKRVTFNTNFQHQFSDHVALQAGANYQWYSTRNFTVVDDLLGADFYLDIDRFAETYNSTDPTFSQNDIETPNRILKEGDVYGYDYTNTVHKAMAWAQGNFSFSKVDFFLAAEGSYTTYWRTGHLQNGKFPDDSKGESDHSTFFNYAVKGGATYKINGRNYIYANGLYMTRAPYMRDAFISPRSRNQLVDSLRSENIYSAEVGYRLRAPRIQLSITGYFTRFFNQVNYTTFFLDNAIPSIDGSSTTGGFVNYVMQGINKQHMGIEFGVDVPIVSGLNFQAAASVGEYIYISRPNVSVYLDYTAAQLIDNQTVYLKNYYVGGTPQMAYTAGFSYNAPKFWFIRINANYFMRNFVDVNPERRTWGAINYLTNQNPTYQQDVVDPNSPLWESILGQEELKGAFTLDLFGGKSWRIRRGEKTYMLYLNVGVSNVLHNTKMITGAFEQFRFDYEDKQVQKFPTRYSYNSGANYYISLTFQL